MRRFIVIVLMLTILATLGGGAYMLYRDTQSPAVSLTPQTGIVSGRTKFNVEALDPDSGIKALIVRTTQDNKHHRIFGKLYPERPGQVLESFVLDGLPIKDGQVDIEIAAIDGSWARFGKANTRIIKQRYALDTTPPKITVNGAPPEIHLGGSGFVSYSLSEDAPTTGIRVGQRFFPGYRQDNGQYYCFFAFPYDQLVNEYKAEVYASDAVGNSVATQLKYTARSRSFREDTMNITDGFLKRKMPLFEKDVPGEMTDLQRFLKVNRGLRAGAAARQMEVGQHTAGKKLWTGVFEKLPMAIITAHFADHRKYFNNNIMIDEQTHMGVDMASTKHADIPAANAGRVIFADFMTIYGNMVMIDHGLGVQTLYSHLSEILVKIGDDIQKGQTIGRTGISGLAGGDHLHFGLLISGVPVVPDEWWDPTWVTQIENRMRQ